MFTTKNLAIICLALSSFGAGALAQANMSPAAQSPADIGSGSVTYPHLDLKNGSPIIVRFDDGREARVFHVEGPADQIKYSTFKVSDNTCSDYFDGRKVAGKTLDLGCKFEVPQMTVGAVLMWTKNPDASKIGKRVKLKDRSVRLQSFENVDALDYLVSPWIKHLASLPTTVKNLTLDERIAPKIVCADYRWLPGATSVGQPVDTKVMRWSTETQQTNVETGDMELEPADQVNGVTLKATADRKLLLGFRQFFSQESYYQYKPYFRPFIPTSTFGTAARMQLALFKDAQTSCSIGLSASEEMNQDTTELNNQTVDDDTDFYPASIKPFIYRAARENMEPKDVAPQTDFIQALPEILKTYDSSKFE